MDTITSLNDFLGRDVLVGDMVAKRKMIVHLRGPTVSGSDIMNSIYLLFPTIEKHWFKFVVLKILDRATGRQVKQIVNPDAVYVTKDIVSIAVTYKGPSERRYDDAARDLEIAYARYQRWLRSTDFKRMYELWKSDPTRVPDWDELDRQHTELGEEVRRLSVAKDEAELLSEQEQERKFTGGRQNRRRQTRKKSKGALRTKRTTRRNKKRTRATRRRV